MISKGKRSQQFTLILEHLLEHLPYLHIIILKKQNKKPQKTKQQKNTLNLEENFKHWDPSLKSQLLQKDKRNRTEINYQSCVGILLSAVELYGYYLCLAKNFRDYIGMS